MQWGETIFDSAFLRTYLNAPAFSKETFIFVRMIIEEISRENANVRKQFT
jgi:hypothetical protein